MTGREISRTVHRVGRRGAASAGALLSALALFFVLFAGSAQAACPATGCDPNDGISPTVQGVSPSEGATVVLPGADVTATFSEAMDPASISPSTFTLLKEGAAEPVTAAVVYEAANNTATLDPAADLAEGATYTATVKGGSDGVKDPVGNTLEPADKTWSFTVADVTPPTVTLTSPAEDEKVGTSATATATASDNLGVQKVEFLVDGTLKSTDAAAPYEATLDMSAFAHGSSHMISARAIDGDGGTATDAKTVTVDRQVSLTLGDSPAQDDFVGAAPVSLSFTTAADVAASGKECRVVQGNAVPGAFSTCSSPFSPNLTADGSYTYEVKVTDDVGNSASASRSFTLDTTAPTLTVDSGPDNEVFGPDATQTWTFSSGDAMSGPPAVECSVVPGGTPPSYGPCSGASSHSVSNKADGRYEFSVRATDKAGNRNELTSLFTIDATAPTATLTDPANATKVGLSVSAAATASDNFAGLRVEFLVDGMVKATDDAAPYSATLNMAAFAHGSSHTVAARAIDGVGNRSALSSSTVTLDRQVALALGDTPAQDAFVSAASVPLSFNTDADVAASGRECRAFEDSTAGASFAACSSPFSPNLTADGSYTYQVRVTDDVGNTASASRTFTLDRTLPSLTVDGGPDGQTFGPNTTQTWTFSSGDATSGPPEVECSVVPAGSAASYGPCSGPSSHSVSDMADGSYTFVGRAADGAGNVREVTRTFTIDATAPNAALTSPADGSKVGGLTSATAIASDNLPGALRMEFLVDGVVRVSDNTAPYEAAVGMETFAHGSQHTVAIRATDGVGNVSTTSSAKVTLDRQVSLTLGGKPAHGSSTNADSVPLAFTTDPDVATAGQTCRVQPNAYAPCASPFSPNLTADGTYTYQVRVTDDVGNVASAQRTFTLDRTAPTLTVSGPDNEVFGPNTTQTWNISAADATTGPPTVQCSVEAAGAAPSYGRCSGPSSHSVTGKADGSYVLSVRATDGAGNVRETSRTFTIDATPPAVTITSGPADGLRTNQTSFTWGFSAAEPGSTFECRVFETAVTAPHFAPCSGSSLGPDFHTASGFSSGNYTFQVRGRDALGNRLDGPSASRTFTVDLVRPRIFSVFPGNRTRNVSPGANVAVTFSEAMEAGSIGKTTFKLTRSGTIRPIAATVTYYAATNKAILNPTRTLQRGVTYRAVVTTGAKDRAGNALAVGKAWTFTVRP